MSSGFLRAGGWIEEQLGHVILLGKGLERLGDFGGGGVARTRIAGEHLGNDGGELGRNVGTERLDGGGGFGGEGHHLLHGGGILFAAEWGLAGEELVEAS